MLDRYPKWLILLVEILFFIGLFSAIQSWQQRDIVQGKAPDFVAQSLRGTEINTVEYRGTPVLIHFWATWCSVCRLQQNTIENIAQTWPVITVALQPGDAKTVDEYRDKHGLQFPIVIDETGELAQRYGVTGVPTSFILDDGGNIRFSAVGYTTSLGLRARLWWTAESSAEVSIHPMAAPDNTG